MATKQIYVKDEDLTVFDEAQALGGDSLSAVIAEALRRFVEAKKAEAEGFGEIALRVGPQGHERTVRFVGRKVGETEILTGSTSERDDRGTTIGIYQGQAGKFVVHVEDWSRWQNEQSRSWHAIVDSLTDLRRPIVQDDAEIDLPQEVGDLLDEVERELGGEYLEV